MGFGKPFIEEEHFMNLGIVAEGIGKQSLKYVFREPFPGGVFFESHAIMTTRLAALFIAFCAERAVRADPSGRCVIRKSFC